MAKNMQSRKPVAATWITAVLFALFVVGKIAAQDAVYQYAVPVASRTAYLWVPPACKQVRGVVAAFANLSERMWLDDPIVRKAMSSVCLAALWIGPGDESLLNADLKPGSEAILNRMFADLATVSGFTELTNAPVIPTGHSAHGQFAWRFAEMEPERTIAALPIKTVPLPADLKIAGIPLLYIVGETTEWPQYRDGRRGDRDFFWPVVRDSARRLRQQNPENLIAVATDPGGGHFDWNVEDAKLVALFLKKSCALRLPRKWASDERMRLRTVREKDGWLVDSSGLDRDRWAPQPARALQSEPDAAYWAFDAEMAEAITRFAGDRVRRLKQMVTVEQDGKALPVAQLGFAAPQFEPDRDDLLFHLQPAYLDAIPKELVGASTPLGHGRERVHMQVVAGPAQQIGPYTFQVAMKRATLDGSVWIEETQDGDAVYRKAVQPIRLQIPIHLTNENAQRIDFRAIPDQGIHAHALRLVARAVSGPPVRFYIDYGPARVVGNRLIFSEIPLHGRRPVEVRVVAYQGGRTVGDKGGEVIEMAEPVVRTFHILLGQKKLTTHRSSGSE